VNGAPTSRKTVAAHFQFVQHIATRRTRNVAAFAEVIRFSEKAIQAGVLNLLWDVRVCRVLRFQLPRL
jgi:hypothetical protein